VILLPAHRAIIRAGFTPSGAPVQKKMWGPLIYEYPVTPPPDPRLPSPDTVGADTHKLYHVEKNEEKKFFFCGAPFLWGPCSAEHAEHA